MSDESAEFYQEHRGDMSRWEETPSRANIRKGDSVVFSFRLSADELESLRAYSANRGISVSELIRTATLRQLTENSVYVDAPVTSTGHFHVSGMDLPTSGPAVLVETTDQGHSIGLATAG